MADTASGSARRSLRRRLCVARGMTVLGIGVAAIASCQRFRENAASGPAELEAQLTRIDACLDRGGHWEADDRHCTEAKVESD
jgi:hypothetical protein